MVIYEDDTHSVLIDISARHLFLETKTPFDRIVQVDEAFANLVVLSETFRDYSDLSFAVAALTANTIEKSSPLWSLGFKGGDTYWTRAAMS